ncbi:MAG: beta-ribofuranosylaminobenzene 5'-phosphate synthase family protein [Thermosphaera aggregans]|uniref:beta-ribofuranosylaminobenzene 5'-phosphate synthase family protein n=1 Tax=Thermosphaera aggregans TaxID=54254 RepID=UPI003C051276
MAEEITVSAPARLHFGMINPFRRDLRLYLGAGLAVNKPRVEVVVRNNKELSFRGSRSKEVGVKLRPLIEKYDLRKGEVEIRKTIPKHVGLGSTTQLLLSVAKGLLAANDIPFNIEEVSSVLNIGRVSGIGKYAFQHGGFIVDSGVKGKDSATLYMRLRFPEDWRFIIVIPEGRGLSDEEEKRVFEAVKNIPESLIHEASYHLFVELIPSIIEEDVEGFSEGLEKLQLVVGKMFSKHQGGVFSKHSEKVVDILKKLGVRGVGQSSWGPAVYGLIPPGENPYEIRNLVSSMVGGDVLIVEPDNSGALLAITKQ